MLHGVPRTSARSPPAVTVAAAAEAGARAMAARVSQRSIGVVCRGAGSLETMPRITPAVALAALPCGCAAGSDATPAAQPPPATGPAPKAAAARFAPTDWPMFGRGPG